MNVNDLVVCGAEPLFFLDYFASGRLDVGVAERVIAGIADGCQQAGCALVGGETAELPGFYADGEYDLAGFCVGVVERSRRIDGRAIEAGDRLLGLASSGFHSNGYSLVRRVLLEKMALRARRDAAGLDAPLADVLLRPTRIYVRALRRLAAADLLRGAAHITGGGLIDNPPRMIPGDAKLKLQIDVGSWTVPPVFDLLARGGGVAPDEMLRTFNMGLGMLVCVPAARVREARTLLEEEGETRLRRRRGRRLRPGRRAGRATAMNVAVLASGSGTNLQALIDSAARGELGPARLAVVGVNVPDCRALGARAGGAVCRRSWSTTVSTRRATSSTARWSRRWIRIRSTSWCSPASCGCSGRPSSAATAAA